MPLLDDGPVVVRHIVVDGSHFFVGHEGCERTEGLCVGSRNMKEAYEQVGPTLEFLAKANRGERVSYKPKLTFVEYQQLFLASIDEDLAQGVRGMRPASDHLPDIGEVTKLWTTLGNSQAYRVTC